MTVRVTDPEGASDEVSFNIGVTDVAPTLSVAGDAATGAGLPYQLVLASSDPGDDTPIEWIIDWGDGSAVQVLSGSATLASHVFAGGGAFTVTAKLRNDDGTFNAAPLPISVAPAPLLLVESGTFVGGDLVIRFSEDLGPNLPTGDKITLVGDLVGAVDVELDFDIEEGVLVISRADGKDLQFDSYRLVLADGSLLSDRGSVLDGDANGTQGGAYSATLVNASATQGIASLPDFMRGPGEHIDVPLAAADGLQVRFSSEGGVKTLRFAVEFDPALLDLADVTAGADLPAGAVLDWSVEAAAGGKSRLIVTVVSDVAIAAGAVHLVSLDASVPDDAPYGASEIITLDVEMINAAAPSSTQQDEALQLVGYFGDADGDRVLTTMDLWTITKVAIGHDDEFAAWQGLPPELIANIVDHRKFANPLLPDFDVADSGSAAGGGFTVGPTCRSAPARLRLDGSGGSLGRNDPTRPNPRSTMKTASRCSMLMAIRFRVRRRRLRARSISRCKAKAMPKPSVRCRTMATCWRRIRPSICTLRRSALLFLPSPLRPAMTEGSSPVCSTG